MPPFLQLCEAKGIPAPTPEYRFTELRKWRMDYAWPQQKVSLEVNGGIFARGKMGHTSGTGALRDMEKNTEAACLGWRVLYTTPQELCDDRTFNRIRAALSYKHPCEK